jgi:hypothetical protein
VSTHDDTHVFANGLTRADVRDIVHTVFVARERRERRSAKNCRYVRELMREREPRIAAAYDEAVRDA